MSENTKQARKNLLDGDNWIEDMFVDKHEKITNFSTHGESRDTVMLTAAILTLTEVFYDMVNEEITPPLKSISEDVTAISTNIPF